VSLTHIIFLCSFASSSTSQCEYSFDAFDSFLPNIQPFHSSFKKDFIPSVEYVAESCSEILGLRSDKAYDLSLFAKHEGFSLLGTWTREECLTMGEQLLERNLDCRVIPFNGGVEPIIGSTPAETRPSGTIDTFYLV
jgi:hypothetical protein